MKTSASVLAELKSDLERCSDVGSRRPKRDWTKQVQKDEHGQRAVRWTDWCNEVLDAVAGGNMSERITALKSLDKLAAYLDDQYDGGYDGIAPYPRQGCNMSFDW